MLTWAIVLLIVLPLLVMAFVIASANMSWGQRLIEQTLEQVSGGQVLLTGLSGHFPDDLHVAHVEVHDEKGPWISVDDIMLQWSPARLFNRGLKISLLQAGRVQLLRLPPLPTFPKSSNEPFKLPLRIDVDRLVVNKMDFSAQLAGGDGAASVTIQGDAHLAALEDGDMFLSVKRTDAPGTYEFNGHIDSAALKAELIVDEPTRGLLSGLVNLPDLGALSMKMNIEGPRNAEAIRFTLAAGPLRASGEGQVDLVGRNVDLDLTASAPAMAPRQDLRWQSISLQAQIHGPFNQPDAKGHLEIEDLLAGGGQLHRLRADIQGNAGKLGLHAVLDRLRLPGPKPDLLKFAPVDLRADVRLDDVTRPLTFLIAHPLFSLQGQANTGKEISGALTLIAPALAPFASIAGVDLKGQAKINAYMTHYDKVTNIDINGTVGATGGMTSAAKLIGNAAKLEVSATLHEDGITLKRAQFDGKALRITADGSSKQGKLGNILDLNWKLALLDLRQLTPKVSGLIEAQGHLKGALDNLALTAEATADVGSKAFPHGPIKASARIHGLPSAPAGKVEARGTLGGSPLLLAVSLERNRDGTLRSTIDSAKWKSARAEGSLKLSADGRLPQGRVVVRIAQLDDLRPWIGQAVQGSVTASVDVAQSAGHTQAKVQVDARNAGVPGAQIEHVTLIGKVDDPLTQPFMALSLVADGIKASAMKGISSSARIEANGLQDALNLKLFADLHNVDEGDIHIGSTATLNTSKKQLLVSALQAEYKGQKAALLAPAKLRFLDGVVVEHLRVGSEKAVLEVAGRISPTLDLTASLRHATPALAKFFMPDLQADGTATVMARLNGTTAQPRGTLKVNANGLRMRTGPGRTFPAASLVATATLNGQSAFLDAKLSAGSQIRLNTRGEVPLSATGPIDLHANGTIDSAIANSILEVNGRRVKGAIAVDIGLSGALPKPRMIGTLKLTEGEIHDYALGAHLTKVEALIKAEDDTIRIVNFTAHAGPGTVSASGSVGVFVPGLPVDVKLTARHAQPLARDLLTATMDLDVTLRGQAQTRLNAAGSINIHRADIKIPNALPPTVAVLNVRRKGQTAPISLASPTLIIGLDLKVDAPAAVFVRGRGLDAEVGGTLHISGTTTAPQISGGLDLRRGSFDLGGTSLKLTEGQVGFNGMGLRKKIDPTLDFEAENTSGNITAKLNVTGYADAPKFAMTSIPELSQDEVLARLLFGVSVKQLNVLQIAQFGAAVAALGGVDVSGGSINPLLALQKSLGLDRLSVSGTAASGANVEVGRYVLDRVYVGAKQGMRGSAQAQVQVDLTKHLKAQATFGTGGTAQGATPDNDPGSSIGLSYQFEY